MKPELLRAGVAELHDLVGYPLRGSAASGRWICDKELASARVGSKMFTATTWRAWLDTVREAQARHILPALCEKTRVARMCYVR